MTQESFEERQGKQEARKLYESSWVKAKLAEAEKGRTVRIVTGSDSISLIAGAIAKVAADRLAEILRGERYKAQATERQFNAGGDINRRELPFEFRNLRTEYGVDVTGRLGHSELLRVLLR